MTSSNLNVQVPTTGTPVQVIGAYGEPFQAANTGTNQVWLGSDSSVKVGTGLPVQPGGSTSWQAGQPLWAVAASGAPSVVTALFGADGSYAPGQSTVTISAPVQVIPQNTVVDLLNTLVTNIPASQTKSFDVTAAASLVGYSSIIILCNIGFGVTPGAQVCAVTLLWSDSNGNILTSDSYTVDSIGGCRIITPVKGAKLQIFVTNGSASAVVLSQMLVCGMTATLNSTFQHFYNAYPAVGTGFSQQAGAVINVARNVCYLDFTLTAASATIYLDSKAGPCQISGLVLVAGGTLNILAKGSTPNELDAFVETLNIGSVAPFSVQAILPNTALVVTVGGSVGTRVRLTLTFNPND